MSAPLAKHQRFMGFDFGTRRIGVAFASAIGTGAQGLSTVRNGPAGPDWQALDQLIVAWEPDAMVVGLPLNMDGSSGPVTPLARRFGNRLAGRYHRHIYWVDERLSSFAADQDLRESGLSAAKRAKILDQTAAEQILATFLAQRSCGPETRE